MSRWLWTLIAGVVLVAIAAAFWIAGNQPDITARISASPTPIAPASAPVLAAKEAAGSATSPPPPPAAEEAATPPPATREAMTPTAPASTASSPPDAGQHGALSPVSSAPPPMTPSAPPVVAKEPTAVPAPPTEAPTPPPAPEREASLEGPSEYAPKNLAQLVGTWAYSAGDCERLFQRRGGRWAYREPVDKFAQAAIVESPKRILLPSAICRIESASGAEGALKVSADCEDSISYTSRSVMIALRSPTELTYSASGNSVLATTLKKCTP